MAVQDQQGSESFDYARLNCSRRDHQRHKTLSSPLSILLRARMQSDPECKPSNISEAHAPRACHENARSSYSHGLGKIADECNHRPDVLISDL
jgi:hypothetical protein